MSPCAREELGDSHGSLGISVYIVVVVRLRYAVGEKKDYPTSAGGVWLQGSVQDPAGLIFDTNLMEDESPKYPSVSDKLCGSGLGMLPLPLLVHIEPLSSCSCRSGPPP